MDDLNEILKQLRAWANCNGCSMPDCSRHMGAQLLQKLDKSLSNGGKLPKPWQWTTDDRISVTE